MTRDSLFECAASVKSRQDFVIFVERLSESQKQGGPEWTNKNLESFLGGLAGFANDMSGFYKNAGEVVDVEMPTWRMTAQMLLAATVYES